MPRGAPSTRVTGRTPLALLVCLWAGVARAQVGTSPPLSTGPTPALEERSAPEPPPRPRMSLAVGFGASLDATGFADGAHPIPAFFGVGGFGRRGGRVRVGRLLDGRLGAISRRRRRAGRPAGLDAFIVVRPLAGVGADDAALRDARPAHLGGRSGRRLRADGRTSGAGSRFEIHTGARIELPLTPAGRPSELRLRLAFRGRSASIPPVLAGSAAPTRSRCRRFDRALPALASSSDRPRPRPPAEVQDPFIRPMIRVVGANSITTEPWQSGRAARSAAPAPPVRRPSKSCRAHAVAPTIDAVLGLPISIGWGATFDLRKLQRWTSDV